MFQYSILLLAGVLSVSTFSSCSKPVATEAGGTARHEIFLEDIGNGVCRQLPSGMMWQIKKSEAISTWEEANEYANRLELGGFNDWRLPTRHECLFFSELLLMKKGDCGITIKKGHWISDNKKRKPGFWDEYPLCGGSEFRWVKSKKGFVRAVRP